MKPGKKAGQEARPTWAEAALVWNTVVWGTTFVVVKAALADVSPILFVALRFTLATAVLLPILRRVRWDWRSAGAGSAAGVFLFAGFLAQTQGLRLTSAPKSAFITGLSPVMVPLLAALVYRNKPRVAEVIGLIVATAGLALMTVWGAAAAVNPGDVLTFLCAIAFAAHIVAVGHFAERMNIEILSVMQIATAAALALGSFWWAESAHIRWRPGVIGAILVTGLLATALAYAIQTWAQQYASSTRTGLIYMLEPVFAWITSYVLAGEGLSRRAAAGAVLILGGVVMVELKPPNPWRHPS